MIKHKEKTKYQEFHELWNEYRTSLELLQKVENGVHIQELPDVAAHEAYIAGLKKVEEAVKNGEDEETAKRKYLVDEVAALRGDEKRGIRPSTDPYVLFPWLKVSEDRTEKDFQKFGKDNLESIVEHTPEDQLEALFKVYLNPKDNKDSKYKDIVKMHEEFKKMSSHLNAYRRKDTPEEVKEKVHSEMVDKLHKYYKEVYKEKGDKLVLEALKSLIKYNTQIAVERYKRFTEWKLEDLNKELDTKAKKAAYVKATLPKDKPFEPYDRMFMEQYAQQHRNAD